MGTECEHDAELPGGYEVLLAVTGGIACYKAADMTSCLVRAGVSVRVAMTEAAARFVTPLTFQALSRRQVYTSLWQSAEDFSSQHISATEAADLMILAPATANILGKMAGGIADDLVSTMLLSTTGSCDVLAAPAMNSRMWMAPGVQGAVERLKGWGVHFIGPDEGPLACGTVGPGRMAEPGRIVSAARELLLRKGPKAPAG